MQCVGVSYRDHQSQIKLKNSHNSVNGLSQLLLCMGLWVESHNLWFFCYNILAWGYQSLIIEKKTCTKSNFTLIPTYNRIMPLDYSCKKENHMHSPLKAINFIEFCIG